MSCFWSHKDQYRLEPEEIVKIFGFDDRQITHVCLTCGKFYIPGVEEGTWYTRDFLISHHEKVEQNAIRQKKRFGQFMSQFK